MAQLVANGFASEEKAERQVMTVETDSAEAEFLKEASRLKKEIGEEAYYRILNAHGLEKSNDAELRGYPEEMAVIVGEMEAERLSGEVRQEMLDKIENPDVPESARENAVMDLMMDLEKEQKLRGECPVDADESYAEIMAGYVSKAMETHDFEKAHATLKRAMDLIQAGED